MSFNKLSSRTLRKLSALLIGGIFLCGCGSNSASGTLELRSGLYVLHLKGSPREMGLAHGRLFREMLPEVKLYLDQIAPEFLRRYLRDQGIIAQMESYLDPHIIEEMEAISEGSAGAVTSEDLLLLNSPIYILYNLLGNMLITPACSGFAAADGATPDGKLLVGRNLDWAAMQFSQKYPTVVFYRPEGRSPFVSLGYPGIVGVLTGMNANGVFSAFHVDLTIKNTLDGTDILFGLRRVMEQADTLSAAENILIDLPRSTGGDVVLASAPDRSASVFEFDPDHYALRRMENGLVFGTNNFIDPDMVPYEAAYVYGSDFRYQRLDELLHQNYGQLDPELAISILRDTYSYETGTNLPPGVDGPTLGNNGNMYSAVFLPEDLVFWTAMGTFPGLRNAYIGFDFRQEIDPGYKSAYPISDFPAQ